MSVSTVQNCYLLRTGEETDRFGAKMCMLWTREHRYEKCVKKHSLLVKPIKNCSQVSQNETFGQITLCHCCKRRRCLKPEMPVSTIQNCYLLRTGEETDRFGAKRCMLWTRSREPPREHRYEQCVKKHSLLVKYIKKMQSGLAKWNFWSDNTLSLLQTTKMFKVRNASQHNSKLLSFTNWRGNGQIWCQ